MTNWSVPHAQSLVVSKNQGHGKGYSDWMRKQCGAEFCRHSKSQNTLELELRKFVAGARGQASRIEHTGIVKRSVGRVRFACQWNAVTSTLIHHTCLTVRQARTLNSFQKGHAKRDRSNGDKHLSRGSVSLSHLVTALV